MTDSIDDFDAILEQAALAQGFDRPSSGTVVQALLAAEKFAKKTRLNYPFEPLLGTWRLCFATGVRQKKADGKSRGIALKGGFYFPKFVPAYISFSSQSADLDTTSNEGDINNQVQVLGVNLIFSGPCRYLGKKNLLAFDFTQLQVRLADRTLYSRDIRGGVARAAKFSTSSIERQPFFAFFKITDRYIAARGRGGGLALWSREA